MDPDKTVVCTVESPNRKMTRRMTIRRRTSSHSPERRNSRSPERLSNADGKPGPQTRRQVTIRSNISATSTPRASQCLHPLDQAEAPEATPEVTNGGEAP